MSTKEHSAATVVAEDRRPVAGSPMAAARPPGEAFVMSNLDELLSNNARFAATGVKDHQPPIPFIPHQQAYILTCVDPRVDPAHLFGLDLGDAIVARTVGGRVTAEVLRDLAWISYLHEVKTPDADWFDLAVMHHTDCGSGLFAEDDLRRGFAARAGFDETELAGLAVLDPAVTVAADVAKLRSYPHLSPRVRVTGLAYDLKTGVAEVIAAPR